MTLSDTPLNRTLATRSLWWTSVAMVLSLAALPAAAQNQLWIDQLGTSSSDGECGEPQEHRRRCPPERVRGQHAVQEPESKCHGRSS